MDLRTLSTPRNREVHLCFHGIGKPRPDLEVGEQGYWITRDQFLRQLDDLAGCGCLRLSFDDGNASDVEIALPALLERGMTATFFLLAGRVDRSGSITRSGIEALVTSGMEIGNHGWCHTPWPHLSTENLRAEISTARATLAELAGVQISRAALPLGQYNRAILSALRKAGYVSVATSDRRMVSTHSWLQPRFSVRAHDTPESIRREIAEAGAFPWRSVLAGKGLAKRLR